MNPENTYNDNRPLVIGGGYNTMPTKTILTGQGVLAPGTVLGVITVGQKLQVCGIGNGNGSETARYVLTKEVDTTGGDVTLQEVLKSGTVNGEKLIFAGVETLASVVAATGLTHDENLKANGIVAVEGHDLELYDNT